MATTRDRVPAAGQEVDGESSRVTIRSAKVPDLAAIGQLEMRSFSNPWDPDTFRVLLRRPRAKVLVAEDPEEGVVGFAVLWWVLDQAELANLAVQPEMRGRGIGSALLDQAISHAGSVGAESLFLEVRASNESAQGLYKSRGFLQISLRKGYYQNPREDARILVKHLASGPSVEDGPGRDGPKKAPDE